MQGQILLVEHDAGLQTELQKELRRRGSGVTACRSGAAALDLIAERAFDVVLTSIRLPGLDGISLCRRIGSVRSDLPVIVVTALGNVDVAVQALRAGAFDFVTKPIRLDILHKAVDRALQHKRLAARVHELSAEVVEGKRYGAMLGASDAMKTMYDRISRVANLDVAVLVTGESGSGKELVAEALHRRSGRRQLPFVPVNCAAVPETLLESELFGHEAGAFTGADRERKGLFRKADGGTLFLDEIADIPLLLQAKLLRAVEERTVRPVGSDTEVPVNVRLVTATNADLDVNVNKGTFRRDLFYRLNVIQVRVAPLRDRGTDILLLAQHFLELFRERYCNTRVARLSRAVAERFMAYPWPGNVRELRNAMERAVALARGRRVKLEDLPRAIREYEARMPSSTADLEPDRGLLTLQAVEAQHIRCVLDAVNGNKSSAARVLGIDRKTLYRKLCASD